MSRRALRAILLACGIAIGLTACGFFWRPLGISSYLGGAFESNGERIYFTATTEDGKRIHPRGGSNFGGMMMGQQQTCASCHGPEGQGGEHFMHMQVMDAPDIRWNTLISSEHGGHDEPDGDGEELPYDEEAFKLALREGVTPGGEQLANDMPRWEMSEEDILDLISFLRTLP